jgi:ABC-2 type transport system permease protein
VKYLLLWKRFVTLALVREAEYRLSFLVNVLEGIAQLGVVLLTYALLYRFTDQVAGWTAAEALMLVGIYRALDGLIALQIAPNMMRMSRYIGEGELDFLLLSPRSSQFLVSLRWLQPPEAVNVLIGIALTIYAGQRAGISWSAPRLLGAVVLAGCGLILLYCMWFALVTLSFWLVKVDSLGYLFYDVWQAGRYPVDYFKGIVRTVFTFVLPIAFATTFPAQALRGDLDPRLLLVGVSLATLALLVTHRFWNYALRRYSSASS